MGRGMYFYEPMVFPNANHGSGLASFRAKLQTLGFEEAGSSRPRLHKNINKIFSPSQFTNAGPIHVALTFGPLTILIGLKL
jgi:hypothetical protein